MKVGVPTEIKADEYRVALTPVGRARARRARPRGADPGRAPGEGSAISDADYEAQGARIVPTADDVFGEADLVLKVKEPQPEEVALLRPEHTPVHVPAPRAGAGADPRPAATRARPASPTRRSRTRAGGCRCWRR